MGVAVGTRVEEVDRGLYDCKTTSFFEPRDENMVDSEAPPLMGVPETV